MNRLTQITVEEEKMKGRSSNKSCLSEISRFSESKKKLTHSSSFVCLLEMNQTKWIRRQFSHEQQCCNENTLEYFLYYIFQRRTISINKNTKTYSGKTQKAIYFKKTNNVSQTECEIIFAVNRSWHVMQTALSFIMRNVISLSNTNPISTYREYLIWITLY